VCQKDREIDGPDWSLPSKTLRTMEEMIEEITRQECERRGASAEHGDLVRRDETPADEQVGERQKDAACGIQRCVDRGEA